MMKSLLITTLLVIVNVSSAFAYVGNTRSGKFHYDDCYWVSRMSEYNMYCTDSRDELEDMGMVPCQHCNP